MKIRLLLAFLLVSAAAFAWMDSAWQYRTAIAVNNSGSALTDYQVLVNTTNFVYNNSGLVGSWHFSEGAGNRTADSSGLGNDGTYKGSSLQFDGVDDYVNVPDSNSLDITGDLSVEAWVRKSTVSDDKGFVISKAAISNVRFAYALFYGRDTSGGGIGVSGRINFFIYDRTNDKLGYVRGFAYDTQQHHVVATWNNTAKWGKLYVDGIDVTEASGTEVGFVSIGTSTDPVYIGLGRGHNAYPWDYFDGNIDEARIYNRTLSASEASEHKQGIFSNGAGLVGYWSMKDGGTSQAVTDDSGLGNNGVRGSSSSAESADPAWSTEAAALWTAGRSGNGLNFNGLDDRVSVGMLNGAALNENSAYSISAWVN